MVHLHVHTVSLGDKTVLFCCVCTLNQTNLIVPVGKNSREILAHMYILGISFVFILVIIK